MGDKSGAVKWECRLGSAGWDQVSKERRSAVNLGEGRTFVVDPDSPKLAAQGNTEFCCTVRNGYDHRVLLAGSIMQVNGNRDIEQALGELVKSKYDVLALWSPLRSRRELKLG